MFGLINNTEIPLKRIENNKIKIEGNRDKENLKNKVNPEKEILSSFEGFNGDTYYCNSKLGQ